MASKLGFRKTRQTGSHERWQHPDGRATTIPVHGGQEIGPPLFHRIITQLGIDTETFAGFVSHPGCRPLASNRSCHLGPLAFPVQAAVDVPLPDAGRLIIPNPGSIDFAYYPAGEIVVHLRLAD